MEEVEEEWKWDEEEEHAGCLLDSYYLITLKENLCTEHYEFFGKAFYYQYDLFIQLMDKLKSVHQNNVGFWGNRNLILVDAPFLTIVVEKATKDIAAFYVMKPRKEKEETIIEFFQVFHEGKGLGRALIEHEASKRPTLVVTVGLHESVGFWSKLGVRVERTC